MQEPICCNDDANYSVFAQVVSGWKRRLFSPLQRNLPLSSLLDGDACTTGEDAEGTGGVLSEEVVQSESRAPVDLMISAVSINRNEPLTVIWEWCLMSLVMVWDWTYQCCDCVTLTWFCIIFQMLLKDNWGNLPHLCSAGGFCEILSWWKFEDPCLFCHCLECLGQCTDPKIKPQKRGRFNASWRAAFLSEENEGQPKREIEKRRQAK